MPGLPLRSQRHWQATALACLLCALIAWPVAASQGAGIGELRAKLGSAREEATGLAAELRSSQEELAAAQQQADAAAAREARLSNLLASGQERAAELGEKVEGSQRRLAAQKARLRRARRVLAQRLVDLYESGSPSAASVILAASNFDELTTRSDYLSRIQDSDEALADRVEQVRNAVRHQLSLVTQLKARVDAYNARLAIARSRIAVVRGNAEAAAARLQSVSAARSASLATLKSKIGTWVSDIEAAEAASRAAAEEAVGRWLGGPYTIPTYIVMCESGGNYSALNPSSGAGGAYQILPSTWALYGGSGSPQDAPKAEQDAIAAQIWADSGAGAWVCAG
jgi:septal ring factor EnvC (AmiA/AmiB activator)